MTLILQELDADRTKCLSWHKRYNLNGLYAFIADQLANVALYYGAELQASAIGTITRQVVRLYPYLTPEDIQLFAQEFCDGLLVRVYGALTAPKVIDALAEYHRRRMQRIEADAYDKHRQVVDSEYQNSPLDGHILKHLSILNYKP